MTLHQALHQTITKDMRSACDFMRDLKKNELTAIWQCVFPNVSVPDDESIIVRMACRMLQKKHEVSNLESMQEIEGMVTALVAENARKTAERQSDVTA